MHLLTEINCLEKVLWNLNNKDKTKYSDNYAWNDIVF